MLATNLNKFNQLRREERRLFVQALLLLPLIHFCLTFLGYSRLCRLMERLVSRKPLDGFASETEILARGDVIARIVNSAAQHGFYRASCLRKSLLVWWLLRNEGIPGRICFGARMVDQKLAAHAWVEYNGIVVNDPAKLHKDYQVLKVVLPHSTLGL